MAKKTLIGVLVRNPGRVRDFERTKSLNVDLLVFNSKGINWSKKRIRGFFFNGTKWEKKSCPFPGAVYNRSYSSERQLVSKIEGVIGKGKVFNCITRFDKWTMHQILQKSSIGSHLPDTYLFQSSQLLKLLSTYRKLILKPCKGSLGKRVYLIEQTDDNKFRLYINIHKNITNEEIPQENLESSDRNTLLDEANKTNIKKQPELMNDERFLVPAKINTLNPEDFIKSINELIKNERFLVQNFIPLDQTNQKIYDIRMYVQKNEQGNWKVTGGLSRLGTSTSYVTNMCTEIKSLNNTIKCNNNLSVDKIKNMKTLGIQIAQILERQIGHLGELSVDFGLDQQGKAWLIEVNGKPQRKIVKRINYSKLTRDIYNTPFKYARSLATNRIEISKINNTSRQLLAGSPLSNNNLQDNKGLLEKIEEHRKNAEENEHKLIGTLRELQDTKKLLAASEAREDKQKKNLVINNEEFNKDLLEKIDQHRKSTDEKMRRMEERDNRITENLRELKETKKLLVTSKEREDKQTKKWWAFWK
ncbi:YheC/YheD family protein [Salipaludibacillus neizhouensis]|uniref:YheC/YheD family protein n=1 Tax=Salipaludibacillus neizhouensis TaxID=885475 RepID=UPI001CBA626B|nr:YheC/YheD family protein [Salipaludibacillus neizhouensis]